MTDDLLEDLDAYVAALPQEAEGPTMDDDLANRVLRRLRRQARARGEVQAVAKAERDRIDAWERDRLETIDADVAGAERMLEGYMRAVHARRNLKTLSLPNGELKLRKPSSRTTIEDEDAFLVWVQERVAASLSERFGEGAASTVDAVLRAMGDEPLLRAKYEPAKGEIGKATEAGPLKSEHDDLQLLAAVLAGEGEAIPGVLVERTTTLRFDYKLASGTDVGQDEPTQGGADDHD